MFNPSGLKEQENSVLFFLARCVNKDVYIHFDVSLDLRTYVTRVRKVIFAVRFRYWFADINNREVKKKIYGFLTRRASSIEINNETLLSNQDRR